MRGLRDKVAIVTGGAGGIGRAICQRLADEGVALGVFDAQQAAAEQAVEALRSSGARAMGCVVDITDYEAVGRAVADFEQQMGLTDLLINNAGWDRLANFLDTTPELWQKIVSINLMGHLNVHHHVLRGMAERRRGRVVNIASDAARVGSSGESVYAACKAGLVALTKTLARELARNDVTLNVVCPGPTDTPLLAGIRDEGEMGRKIYEGLKRAIPLGRLGQPEDVAGIVAFLASDEAAFITGQVISVSGGLTMNG